MPATLEQISPKPILLMRYPGNFVPGELPPLFVEIAKVADQIQPVYVIVDLSQLSLDFGGIMLGMAEGMLSGAGSGGDPRVKTVLVGKLEMVGFISDALKQKQYGQVSVPAFASVDEALEYIDGL